MKCVAEGDGGSSRLIEKCNLVESLLKRHVKKTDASKFVQPPLCTRHEVKSFFEMMTSERSFRKKLMMNWQSIYLLLWHLIWLLLFRGKMLQSVRIQLFLKICLLLMPMLQTAPWTALLFKKSCFSLSWNITTSCRFHWLFYWKNKVQMWIVERWWTCFWSKLL